MSWLPRKNVVVPIDFSPASEEAVTTALELSGDKDAVHLVHVLYPLDHVSPGVVWGDVSDAKREEAVRSKLEGIAAAQGAGTARIAVRFGDPGLEIAEYAESVAAELIVIPSHGYHGVQRVLIGSVAERVIRHAACPVLVLRRDGQ